ncbi:MAG: phage baseplate plug protein [Lacrimispora sphenoides]
MSVFVIPLTTEPNQSFNCTIPIDGTNRPLSFLLRYNAIAAYWNLTIIDARTRETLIDAIPLMAGEYPAANLLEQFSYMKIGSAVIVREDDLKEIDNPNDKNLSTEYYLVWGDTA